MVDADEKPAIYAYAQHLFRKNLERMLKAGKNSSDDYSARRASLAERTSNAAFGVVEGLSSWVQPEFPNLSAPDHLDACRDELQRKLF